VVAHCSWSIESNGKNNGTDLFKLMKDAPLDIKFEEHITIKRRNGEIGYDVKKFKKRIPDGVAHIRWLVALWYFIR